MRAAVLVAPDTVEVRDVEIPAPAPDEVLIHVTACGLNRADIIMASKPSPGWKVGIGSVLGLEGAGTISTVGDAVADWRIGERVMAPLRGGFAEFAVAPASNLFPVPPRIDFNKAATLPIALQTMHDAIVTNGRLQAGESVLILGASSGVGIMGMQVAKAMGAGLVIGTSSDPERRARLTEFGADLAIDTQDPSWPDQVTQASRGGVNLIVDQVSGNTLAGSLKAAAVCGRIVNVGRLGGHFASFDCDLHALKRITYVGVTFRTRTAQEKADVVRLARRDLWQAVEEDKLRLPIDRVFPLGEVNAAFGCMRENKHFGKIILDTRSPS